MSFWAEHTEELAIILNRVEASLNGRLAWVAAHKPEVHHAAPCCLLTLPEKANGSPLDGEGASTALVVNGDFFKLVNRMWLARFDVQVLGSAQIPLTTCQLPFRSFELLRFLDDLE